MAPSVTTPLTTPLTQLLGIQHPVILAGMAHTSTARLASAVSAAGALGTLGGLGYSPDQLREMIQEFKDLVQARTTAVAGSGEHSVGTTAANDGGNKILLGVDLALPKVGDGARKTNHDYTGGKLDELVDVVVTEGARLFISAVGVPPRRVIERLHAGGVVVMNMVGKPEHAVKAFDEGVDIVCAQGGEGGGHTGDVPTGVLVPACVDVARRYRPPMLKGQQGLVVAAGGIYDGRGLAAALSMGAVGVWVGTRFVASEEAGCSQAHKEAVVTAGWSDTLRTLVITGRPLRVRRNEYVAAWEEKAEEIKHLTEQGVIPFEKDMDEDKDFDMPFLMGQVAGAIHDIKPAKQIVEEMVSEAVSMLQTVNTYLGHDKSAKL